MKKIKLFIQLTGFLLCLLGASGYAISEPILVFDQSESEARIAKRYRVDLQLRASASGQFSADELPKILRAIPTERRDIWVIDLRQESHGFIDGLPVSWYGHYNAANKDKNAAEIEKTENKLLRELSKKKTIVVMHIKKLPEGEFAVENPVTMIPELVESEQELVHGLGAQYARIYALDHFKPSDAEVDNFVNLIKYKIKEDAWLHFHCRGGGGRSSTFSAMYAMLRNAEKATFTDIMQQQLQNGNSSLNGVIEKPYKLWKTGGAKERSVFLQEFYKYARDPQGYKKRSWTTWKKLQQSK